jgi:LacI family transcriptional regulator
MAAEHLLERGFQNFGFTGFSNYGWSCERQSGFVEALRLAGKRCDVFNVNYPGDVTPAWDDNQISGLAKWLKRLPKPVGIMTCFDLRASQILHAAYTNEILVPEELAVIGANNDLIRCEMAMPPLSSVAPNAFQSGYRAAEVLAEMLSGKRFDSLDERIEPLGVVTRPSTDVLAIEDKSLASALNFIRQRACQGISVAQVVRHAYASRSQLEKKFRRHLGRSPQAEIRRVQVAKIRQLLAETDFPLKKIAEMTGFEYVEYMCVVFKRITGQSPGECRRKTAVKSMH